MNKNNKNIILGSMNDNNNGDDNEQRDYDDVNDDYQG